MGSLKSFLISLIDDDRFALSTLPRIILKLNEVDCNSFIIGELRDKISEKFILKAQAYNYSLFTKQNGVFTGLNMLDEFSKHSQDKNEFYLSHFSSKELNEMEEKFQLLKQKEEHKKQIKLIKKDNMDKLADEEEEKIAQKQKNENFIRTLLKISIKSPTTFSSILGDLKTIMLKEELKLPEPIEISSDDKTELEKFVYVLEKMHSYRLYECEAEKHIVISDLFASCLHLLSRISKKILMHDEFVVKPDFVEENEKDIVRIVNCSIFKDDNSILVCLCEIEKDDCNECLRQNADLLRAYCISFNKKVCRGIATNGTIWYFTQFEKYGEKLIVSKPYNVIKFLNMRFRGFVDHVEFFGLLMAYILDSEEFMTKNNI